MISFLLKRSRFLYRLSQHFGLKSDVLFPNPDIPLPKILGNIASRGVLYAIVVTPLNEEHGSMTVNILQVWPLTKYHSTFLLFLAKKALLI